MCYYMCYYVMNNDSIATQLLQKFTNKRKNIFFLEVTWWYFLVSSSFFSKSYLIENTLKDLRIRHVVSQQECQ